MLAKDKNGRHKLSKSPESGSGQVQLLLNKTGSQRPGVDFKGTQVVGHNTPYRPALGAVLVRVPVIIITHLFGLHNSRTRKVRGAFSSLEDESRKWRDPAVSYEPPGK